jgi:UDP-N-acetylglucosamine 2-epimerase (non-hydrolysing)
VTIRVGVFAATRADLSPLGPVIGALAHDPAVQVTLLASGTIGNQDFGDPLTGVDLQGVAVEPVAGGLGSSDYHSMTEGGARISRAMAATLERLDPHVCLVLGDRWELLYAVPPIVLKGVPLVHLHGGEVTEGAIDDRIRHATSKLADLHCVSTRGAASRLRAMGEPADRVFVTGAPSLDRFAAVIPATEARLTELLGRPLVRPFALVTYHPATASGHDPALGARDTLAAVADTVGSALITHPGLDRGREAVVASIDAATRDSPQLVAVASLGPDYLPVLAAADVVVGNSSSGLIEAASFGVPVVDVGDRQRGRQSSGNVVHAAENRELISAAIRRCLDPAFREQARTAVNPYGDGHAAERIVEVVRLAAAGDFARKPFVDAEAGAGR